MNLLGWKKKPLRARKSATAQGTDDLFRRNRNLSGREERPAGPLSSIDSSRLDSHQLKRRRNKLLGLLVCVTLALGTIVWLMSQYTSHIDSVRTASQAQLDPSLADEYTATANTYFAAHPQERLRFWRQDEALSLALRQSHPEIENATVAASGLFGAGNLSVTLRRPVVSWNIDQTAYYVDRSGAAFTRDINRGAEELLEVTDNSGASASDGRVASRQSLAFVGQVVAQLEQNKFSVNRVVIPAGTIREVQIYPADKSYYYRLYSAREVAGQVADILATEKYVAERKLSPEYFDVRVEGKAFYR